MTHIEVPNAVILDNLYINIVLGRDLFNQIIDHYGKAGWNAYSRKLRQHDIWAMYSTPEPTEDDEHCMPVCVQVDWNGLTFRNADLSGLDLTIPTMERCDFRGADLSGSSLGDVRGSSFHDSNLNGTLFQGDISACDFRGARMTDAVFDQSRHFREKPPTHLPEAHMDMCKRFPAHWRYDEEESNKEQRHVIKPNSTDLRSFWGALR